jgi:hypothetical protein
MNETCWVNMNLKKYSRDFTSILFTNKLCSELCRINTIGLWFSYSDFPSPIKSPMTPRSMLEKGNVFSNPLNHGLESPCPCSHVI